jgi:hypothetical protein
MINFLNKRNIDVNVESKIKKLIFALQILLID